MDEMKEKSKGQKLLDKLTYNSKNAWEVIPDRELIFSFCDGYKAFWIRLNGTDICPRSSSRG